MDQIMVDVLESAETVAKLKNHGAPLASTTPNLKVPLVWIPRDIAVRRGEPVRVGLPFPEGAVQNPETIQLKDGGDQRQPLQCLVLDRWTDGSIRWCLFDFYADVHPDASEWYLCTGNPTPTNSTSATVPTAFAQLELALQVPGSERQFVPLRWLPEANHCGQIRQRFQLQSVRCQGLEFFGFIDWYPDKKIAQYQLSVRNPNAAGHPGGNWDLGNAGSIDIRELSWTVRTTTSDPKEIQFSLAPAQAVQTAKQEIEVYQDSSGGENWNSENHIDRDREIPLQFSGYRFKIDGQEQHGPRATPMVRLQNTREQIGLTTTYFWQNFPKCIRATENSITIELFPAQSKKPQELQGGEQKTHFGTIEFAANNITDDSLTWARTPLIVQARPSWYAQCNVIPYFHTEVDEPYSQLMNQAIDGENTFVHKRELIDEYGWRHFGDIYGDHEATRHPGPKPLISHFNNQYDCVAGFAYQFLRTGDPRWFDFMIETADHTCDIDTYHTTQDRSAYNQGMFWHTYHYAHADTSTHRSYPKRIRTGPQDTRVEKIEQFDEKTAAKVLKSYQVGGGPAASHNYGYGLTLAYFLTGNPIYRDTAIQLADFVISTENPKTTVFRWLSSEHTGLATESGGSGYHGPGRAPGNSLLALLNGFRMTKDRKYLDFADVIIRRVSHPHQDINALDLLNAELYWFYTMYLQALGRYLDEKIEINDLDSNYAYAQLTLLHFARWMLKNEYPILDKPEKLQYPTETWAAQDMRKMEIFQYAAKHAQDPIERQAFLDKAEWFYQYVVNKLHEMPTKHLCRPVALMLNYGWSRNWWRAHDSAQAPKATVAVQAKDFGTWTMFVSQKTKAIRRAKQLMVLGALGFIVLVVAGFVWLGS